MLLLKGTRNSYFCANPKNQALHETFPQITQKILTEDIIHWLELITQILNLRHIFSVRKTTIQLFNISEYQQKTIFLAYFVSLKANCR